MGPSFLYTQTHCIQLIYCGLSILAQSQITWHALLDLFTLHYLSIYQESTLHKTFVNFLTFGRKVCSIYFTVDLQKPLAFSENDTGNTIEVSIYPVFHISWWLGYLNTVVSKSAGYLYIVIYRIHNKRNSLYPFSSLQLLCKFKCNTKTTFKPDPRILVVLRIHIH